MRIRFAETTRGRGMIFIRLVLSKVPDTCTLRATSATKDGSPLPCKLYDPDNVHGRVLALPIISMPQVATVEVLGPEGGVRGSYSKTVSPTSARLSSQFNTATRNPVTAVTRNCDTRLPVQGYEIIIDRMIRDHNDDIVQASAIMTALTREEVEGPLDVSVLGPDGHPLVTDPWILMSDTLRPQPDKEDGFIRTFVFSVRIPHELPSAVIVVHGPDDEAPSGFCVLHEAMMNDLRRDWANITTAADVDPAYEKWFLDRHRVTQRDLELQRQKIFESYPTYSFVVPVFHPAPVHLRAMIDSVLAQTYPRFELILINASHENEEVSDVITEYIDRDERVRCIALEGNRGIVGNTNVGIRAATGDFICFMDHDDTIEPDLLYWYTDGINDYPETDLLYCDEDKLENDHYVSVFLKPDWDPIYLLSSNYVCHLLTVRAATLAQVELSDDSVNGAQDHDLTLKVGEVARNIYHCRRVLYHWRVTTSSTAATAEAKSYTQLAGIKAVQDHLDRIGMDATVSAHATIPNCYRVDYHFETTPPVSIVIPNKDMTDMLDRCLTSILELSTYPNFEIVIVENNSTDEATFAYYEDIQRRDPRIRVVVQTADGTFNYPRIVNYGVFHARGEYLILLNNDTQVITPDWIEQLLGPCITAGMGAVGAKLLYPDGTIQHAGVRYHHNGPDHLGRYLPNDSLLYYGICQLFHGCSAVTAACLLVKRSVYDEVGGFDEAWKCDFNDVDFCLKIRAHGYLVAYRPEVVLRHDESPSRGIHDSRAKQEQFYHETVLLWDQWPRYVLWGDPMLNEHLENSAYYTLDKNS